MKKIIFNIFGLAFLAACATKNFEPVKADPDMAPELGEMEYVFIDEAGNVYIEEIIEITPAPAAVEISHEPR
ncbi:MAG: hypothetical protein FWD15_06365, partial [Alphaproteobacteria bacterium]|nr:hypothetical protein [Alphaproteobacteria bacterium]